MRLDSLLDLAAEYVPHHGIRFVGGPTYSWPAFREAALRAAGGAYAAGVRPGQPVLLLVADPAAFFPLFWGVVRLGATAVPLAPPRDFSDAERARVERVHALLDGPVVSDLPIPGVADAHEWLEAPPRVEPGPADAPALLQFSSGSTREPRGVVLTHANLLANIAQLRAALPLTQADVDLSWMPHFHDMGLIGCHLLPLAIGMSQVRMRPEHAMADPLVWLRAAAEHRATALSTTNFALVRANRRLTTERPDLSSVRWLFNGAEPIDPAACRTFSALTGVPERAHVPMYGLAEATVGVCCAPDGLRTVVLDGRERVDLGPPLPGVRVRVVDGDDELPSGSVGSVQVAGPNVTAGYWKDDQESARLRCGEWIRTGDVGALVDGRLVLVGRDKDLVIVNGRNLPAHDVEEVAEAVPGVRAAVAGTDGRVAAEALVVGILRMPDVATVDVLIEVRRRLSAALGAEARVVPLDRVERTTSGKKRRAAFRAAVTAGTFDAAVGADTVVTIRSAWEAALRRPLAEGELDVPFRDLGGGSLAAVELLAAVGRRYGFAPDHRVLLEGDSVRRMARQVEQRAPTVATVRPGVPSTSIAIIASACRLPTAITAGRHGAGGWLDDVAGFDAERFGIPSEEAAAIDPQQRLFLTVAADALARAGGGPGRVGVYVGAGQQAYMEAVLDGLDRVELPPGTLAGNLLSMLAGRVAHTLDLRGPALTVDTACSASLVAVHLACQALRAGECDIALAGGVNLNLSDTVGRLFGLAGALSPTGRCRPFASDADGTVPGEGAGVVVLKPLDRARADGDRVLAVIRGSAVNNDGASFGVMAPNPAGQEAVIRAALASAGVDPGDIRYVEAHATGTAVGDAVERAVLARCYPHGPRVGGIKGQVGHLLGAAGIAGLLQAIGELGVGELGAVSSFGFGGTNAHVVLEGGDAKEDRPGLVDRPKRHWLGEKPVVDTEARTGHWLHLVSRDVAGGLVWTPLPRSDTNVLKRGGRYVITGATGGIGRALVLWLARRWSARLVLLGRRDGSALVHAVRAAGGDATFLRGDLATETTALLARACEGGVDGVFHLAGGLDEAGLAAKVKGAEALRGRDAGLVVLFSSISAVLPGLDKGIEAYAAANATLDRLAREERGWVSIAWPPWEGAGLAADVAEGLGARGITPISANVAFSVLEPALAAGVPNVVVMERVAIPMGAAPVDLRERVRRLIADAASLPVEKVGDHDRLTRLGVDSISAVELVKALEEVVGRRLPSTLLYERDTIDGIVTAIAGGVSREVAPAAPATRTLLPSQQTFLVQRAYFPDIPGNVLLACSVSPSFTQAELAAAVARITERHPMVSAAFGRGASGWELTKGAPPAVRWGPCDPLQVHQEPFDLENGPLLRVCSDGTRIVLDAHHGVVDAWSLHVVLLDLLTALGGAPLAPLRAGWEEADAALRSVQGGDPTWWEARFRDGVPPLPLPWDASPDEPVHGACGVVTREWSEADTALLVARAREAEVSLPALVLASYLECLWRWSGQHDLVVRVAQGRREVRVPEVERIVGPFADSLPVRVRVRSGEGLDELARRVAKELATVGAQAGASAIGLASLAERGGAPTGLTPAGFSFPLLPAPAQVGGRDVFDVLGASASGFTRIGLIAWVFDGRLHASWNHLESHLSRPKMEAWADDHATALRSFAHHQQENRPDAVHLRILARAALHPEREAVVGGLTYGALARRSAALAARLIPRLGDAPRVAILAYPGIDAVVAMLAVLRAGAAWVGLDPSWPDARVAQVVEIAAPAVIVASPEHAERAASFGQVETIGTEEADDGPARVGPLAHVMFTSGSTGRPKGVAVGHAALTAFLDWVEAVLGVTEADRFVQTSSLSFGGCIRQVFTPLSTGGAVVPAPPHAMRDPDALLDLLERERVTVFNAVPSVWMHLLEAVERRAQDALPTVRWVLIGGEAVPAAFTRRWRARFGRRHRLANLYGSTETVVNATWHEVVGDTDEALTPIGWPRSGVTVSLLGPGDRPLAVGEVGEIVVGGAIAEGYLFDLEQTERAFVTLPGLGRVYRTGDLARRRPDGALVYVGRADSQVQVRGNRVELGEIEAVLAGHPAVAHAVVLAPEGRIVATVEPRGACEGEEIRAWLAERLPVWMVPARVDVVEKIPRNAAGKVDRSAVADGSPLPPGRRPQAAAAPSPSPRKRGEGTDEARSLVAAAWKAVLHLDAHPPSDADFFALGGDSVDVLDAIAWLRERGAVPPPPLVFYRARTLSAVAALCALDGGPPSSRAPPKLEEHTWPLSPVQRGFWLAHRMEGPPIWTASVPLDGPLDLDAFCAAVAAVVERHPLLRASFHLTDTGPVQRINPTRAVAVPYGDHEDLRPAPWDLASGPLFRMRLRRVGPERHEWLLAAHHIIADAWSAWLVAGEILAVHEAKGDASVLPPLDADYRAEIRRAADEAPDPWWETTLRGLAQPPYTGPSSAEARVTLDADAWARLRRHARRHGRTPFVTVLAAFAEALHETAPSPDLLVSVALAGREDPALAGVVGPFAAGLPVRIGDADEAGVAAALDAALAHPSVAGVAAAGGGLARLGRYFLTWLDPATLPDPGTTLRPRWSEGRYRFDVGSTGTELLAAALVGDGLRIDLTGGPRVTAVAAALERRLRERCRADAALIVYLPEGITEPPPVPVRIESVDGAIGTSDLVLLPLPGSALAAADLGPAIARAVRCTDARVVALAGMLPALSGLGLRPLWEGAPTLTTGHGATVVAMLFTVQEALRRTGADWETLTVGFCGLGAIGQAVHDLTVAVLGPPARVLRSDPRVSDATDDLYASDWILAATSGGVTLDVTRLRPGTVVIDDSFPRAFDDAAARTRMETRRDVLLVGGGMLDPGPLDRRSPFPGADAVRERFGARWLPGCHAEALLVASDPWLGPTVGPVTVERALAVRAAAERAGLRAAPLHLGAWEVPEVAVAGCRR